MKPTKRQRNRRTTATALPSESPFPTDQSRLGDTASQHRSTFPLDSTTAQSVSVSIMSLFNQRPSSTIATTSLRPNSSTSSQLIQYSDQDENEGGRAADDRELFPVTNIQLKLIHPVSFSSTDNTTWRLVSKDMRNIAAHESMPNFHSAPSSEVLSSSSSHSIRMTSAIPGPESYNGERGVNGLIYSHDLGDLVPQRTTTTTTEGSRPPVETNAPSDKRLSQDILSDTSKDAIAKFSQRSSGKWGLHTPEKSSFPHHHAINDTSGETKLKANDTGSSVVNNSYLSLKSQGHSVLNESSYWFDYNQTNTLNSSREFDREHSGIVVDTRGLNSNIGGWILSSTAIISLAVTGLIAFWLILGPVLCLLARRSALRARGMKDKETTRRLGGYERAEVEHTEEPTANDQIFSAQVLSSRERAKMYRTNLLDDKEEERFQVVYSASSAEIFEKSDLVSQPCRTSRLVHSRSTDRAPAVSAILSSRSVSRLVPCRNSDYRISPSESLHVVTASPALSHFAQSFRTVPILQDSLAVCQTESTIDSGYETLACHHLLADSSCGKTPVRGPLTSSLTGQCYLESPYQHIVPKNDDCKLDLQTNSQFSRINTSAKFNVVLPNDTPPPVPARSRTITNLPHGRAMDEKNVNRVHPPVTHRTAALTSYHGTGQPNRTVEAMNYGRRFPTMGQTCLRNSYARSHGGLGPGSCQTGLIAKVDHAQSREYVVAAKTEVNHDANDVNPERGIAPVRSVAPSRSVNPAKIDVNNSGNDAVAAGTDLIPSRDIILARDRIASVEANSTESSRIRSPRHISNEPLSPKLPPKLSHSLRQNSGYTLMS